MVSTPKPIEFFQKIGTTITAAVSGHGHGLYVLIPKRLARAHKIVAGDVLEIELQRHYKPGGE